jgi:hypothetical protein
MMLRPAIRGSLGDTSGMKIRVLVQGAGKTAAGIEIPPDVVAALGAGKKPPVRITIGGHTYRSTVATMNGVFMVGVSNENREKAGVAAGDVVDVEIELDTAPREVSVPPELQAALDADPAAAAFFGTLSYSNRLRHALAVGNAKTAETRQRNIDKAIALFREGRS